LFERGIERTMSYFTANLTREEDEVREEMRRQDAKFGPQNHPDGTSDSHDAKAHADLAREWCQDAAATGEVTWQHILCEEASEAFAEVDPEKLLNELLQVEAVARQWRLAIRRRLAGQSGDAL